MNRYRENRALGSFIIGVALATLFALYFWWSSRSSFAEQNARLNENAMELNRLQRLDPYPNRANLKTLQGQAQEYKSALEKLRQELTARTLPVSAMAPTEFQERLREAVARVTEKAQAGKTALPENFYLGFEEFSSALPSTAAAPLLGQQLAQVEMLLNIMLEARIDGITSFKRTRLSEEGAAPPPPSPTPVRKGMPLTARAETVDRSAVEVTFSSNPAALRRVLNAVAGATEQFYLVRHLRVLNEKTEGPPRELGSGAAAAAPTPAPTSGGTSSNQSTAGLTFIVGTEKVITGARIELLRFGGTLSGAGLPSGRLNSRGEGTPAPARSPVRGVGTR